MVGTKSYIRFKEREDERIDGALKMIVLDIAGV
ncbi:hypothetical protein O6B72_08930 [Campylobacter ureolyticus]|nr:hypothetical protein [Campylobacter ureolyticus]MCZ6156881.1 hypothetical protein [Campylobacter ureolyticus]MCZ6156929.1 hypothetical protein [Campylobacter ureolyticus]